MATVIPPLPEAFVKQMRIQLGEEAEQYFQSMEKPYFRGVRCNPRRKTLSQHVDFEAPIPWANQAYYLTLESKLGAHILHDIGAYYLQEPSAMIPVSVLDVKPGEYVLDLCAAPGGKSTQIADCLQGKGLLVANEPNISRAKILASNIERMGIRNALVVSAEPSQLAKQWKNAFDAILVDAPCSGEGMFRRHPETRENWSPQSPKGCRDRQLNILGQAITMLKPGGRLVYSTCTLNTLENEEVVQSILQQEETLSTQDFTVHSYPNDIKSIKGMLRVYPHTIKGEGHFLALFKKKESLHSPFIFSPPSIALGKVEQGLGVAWSAFEKQYPSITSTMTLAQLGQTLICAPNLPPLKGIKVLRAGLHLGKLKGKTFIPDHALALALTETDIPTITIDEKQAQQYVHGETLLVESALHGFVLVTWEGYILGFGKISDGQCKNHYPKGLRR